MTSSMTVTPATEVGPLLGPALRGSLIAGSVLLVAGTAITPAADPEAATYLADVALHPDRVAAGGVLFLLGHMLLVPAVLAVARVRRTAGVAAVVAGLAAIPFAGLGLTRLFEVALATSVEPAVGAAVLEEVHAMPVATAVILPALAALHLGLVVMLVALYRRRLLAAWPIATAVLGTIGVSVGGDGTPAGVAGSMLLGATMVGLTLTRKAT